MAGTKNLKPVRTKEEAKERGKNGGIKSGAARREKRLLSQIYAEILAEENEVEPGNIKDVVRAIIKKQGAAAVSMLKEVREATEGNKLNLDGSNIKIVFEDDK